MPVLMSVPSGGSEPLATREQSTEIAKLDLDAIAERGYLRVLIAPSDTHFQTVNGRHLGRAVDLGVDLADAIGRESGKAVKAVFIETREDQLIPRLLEGRGDVAANLLLTFARDEQVAFTPPIVASIRELVVTSAKQPLVSLEDVGGRVIHVRKDTDHHASLLRLNEQLIKIDRAPARIVTDASAKTDEELLRRVNDGKIPATITYSYIYGLLRKELPGIAVNYDVAVSQDGQLSWVTRKDAVKLIELMKRYFTERHFGFES
jgi:membrane-bound lytic murein transglycosylase MltF